MQYTATLVNPGHPDIVICAGERGEIQITGLEEYDDLTRVLRFIFNHCDSSALNVGSAFTRSVRIACFIAGKLDLPVNL